MVLDLFMLLVWHRIGGKSSGGVHLLNWLVIRVFYAATDFMMLNAVNLRWFVTLTLWHFVTPHERLDWFTATRECDFF